MVIALAVVAAAAGVWSFSRLPIDAYPDLSPPTVEITTQWPGQAAEEVERLITVPIETEMNGLPGLDVVRSISLYGLSDVRLVFKDGTDNYFARERVFEKLRDVDVPDGVEPGRRAAVLPLRAGVPLRPAEPRPLPDGAQDDPGLGAVEGLQGGARRGRPVGVRRPDDAVPGRARSHPARRRGPLGPGASPRRWARTTATPAADSTPRAGSSTTCAAWAGCRCPRTSARSSSRCKNGTPILVRDVGQVVIGYAPRLGQFGFNDQPDAVEGVVLMRTGEQAQTVLKGVEAEDGEAELDGAAEGRARSSRSTTGAT